jgi:hypothetical protein
MREIRYTSFSPAGPAITPVGQDTGEPDAVLDPNDPIFQIMGGQAPKRDFSQLQAWQKDNPASNRARIMRETGIKPGTPAWFALWFGK